MSWGNEPDKTELEGYWIAQYNRTDDDYRLKNPDSDVLFSMIMKLHKRIEELEEKLEEQE
jgi:hypothetical protein